MISRRLMLCGLALVASYVQANASVDWCGFRGPGGPAVAGSRLPLRSDKYPYCLGK